LDVGSRQLGVGSMQLAVGSRQLAVAVAVGSSSMQGQWASRQLVGVSKELAVGKLAVAVGCTHLAVSMVYGSRYSGFEIQLTVPTHHSPLTTHHSHTHYSPFTAPQINLLFLATKPTLVIQTRMPTIYDRITEFNKGRLPEMLQLKYKAMAASMFAFFRGTCHLFYEDLSNNDMLPASPLSWICGDLHLENFGSFKGDNHMEYFDLNDFDEAVLSPAAWELTRMATSIFVENENLGFPESNATQAVDMFLNTYSSVLKNGKAIGVDPRTADGIVREFLENVEKRKQRELLKKRTYLKKGKLLLLADSRHFDLEKSLKSELMVFVEAAVKHIDCLHYHYEVQDAIFRLAGTGSVGVKRYMFLLKNLDVKKKYLLIDMKQALPSSLAPYLSIRQPAWPSEAERVIAVQKRMQNVSPALLSPVFYKEQPYVIKQLQPLEDKINFDVLKGRGKDIEKVIKEMGVLTASAQLRSSGRQNSAIADELIAFGQNNDWRAGVLRYAEKYLLQVKKDYQEFLEGYKKGIYGKR